ncbi:MAG: hypothetical protein PHI97_21435 [Desulfobulbus sp.]|nr:hypothetical protein [Desulfobulbus sp.]
MSIAAFTESPIGNVLDLTKTLPTDARHFISSYSPLPVPYLKYFFTKGNNNVFSGIKFNTTPPPIRFKTLAGQRLPERHPFTRAARS